MSDAGRVGRASPVVSFVRSPISLHHSYFLPVTVKRTPRGARLKDHRCGPCPAALGASPARRARLLRGPIGRSRAPGLLLRCSAPSRPQVASPARREQCRRAGIRALSRRTWRHPGAGGPRTSVLAGMIKVLAGAHIRVCAVFERPLAPQMMHGECGLLRHGAASSMAWW